MPDYLQSKLFSLRSNQTDDIFIGSTTQNLSKLMVSLRRNYKKYLDGKCPYNTSFELLKYPDVYIELIKYVPCKNKEELAKEEGLEIRNRVCVNTLCNRNQKKISLEDKLTELVKQQEHEINLINKKYELIINTLKKNYINV